MFFFFFSSRRRHTRYWRDWSSDVCSSDLYFYSAQVEAINRDRLKTNEMLLQNTVTRSLADDISQHQQTLRMMLRSEERRVGKSVDLGWRRMIQKKKDNKRWIPTSYNRYRI